MVGFFLFWFGGILFGFLFSWFLCTTVQQIGFSLKATSWSGTRIKKQCFLLTAEQEEEREEKDSSCPICTAAKSLSWRHSEMLCKVDCGIDTQITVVPSNLVVRKMGNSGRKFCFLLTCCAFGNVPSQTWRACGSNTENIQLFNRVMQHTVKAAPIITYKPEFHPVRLRSVQLKELKQSGDTWSLGKEGPSLITTTLDIPGHSNSISLMIHLPIYYKGYIQLWIYCSIMQ